MLLQEIGSHSWDIAFKECQAEKDDLVLAMSGAEIFMNAANQKFYTVEEFIALGESLTVEKSMKEDESMAAEESQDTKAAADLVFAFELDGKKVFLPANVPAAVKENSHKAYVRDFGKEAPELQLAGATAMHLNSWYKSHQYCGCCGGKNHPDKKERAMRCEKCGHMSFPVICPAIICAVIDKEKDRILLTRSAHRKGRIFSLVAGYTEIGETLEQTCEREVMEEVGVKIKNIRPFINQPWGFSSSLMLGFFAELDGSDEITIQESEIAEAKWFTREEMPVTESPIDITHYMMELWRTGEVEV